MTLTELRYIVTLAQCQHFGQAAERCHVSQPTLSIAVKKLEGELGVELFERTKSSVRATPTGERVIAQANRVLDAASAIKDIASEGHDQLNQPLQVGAIFTIGPYLFPHFIPKLQAAAPQMPLVIEEGYTATLRKRLRNGEVDVIVVALPFSESDVVVQPLYSEPFVVLLPANHKLASCKAIEPAQLADQNLLLLGQGHCFRDQILETLPELTPNPAALETGIHTMTEGSSLETLRHMVASGLGVTILPQSAALNESYRSGELITRPFSATGGRVPRRTTALAWRASFPRHRAIDALRNAILATELAEQLGTAKV